MPFELLKQVVSHLKKKSVCPFCKSKFTDSSIFVLASNMSAANESAQGLFLIVCPKCSSQAFILTELSAGVAYDMPLSDESIRVQTKSTSEVSTNDILDMHNFLKGFKGDVSKLFKEL